MNVAVIDIGSNTIKMLVANEEQSLLKKVYEVRLLSNNQKLQQPVIDKAIEAIKKLLKSSEPFEPNRTLIVATSAVRESLNKEQFINAVQKATGQPLKVLTHLEEAQYIADGILADPHVSINNEALLLDLGGGSLECIHYKDNSINKLDSFPLGAVRLMNQYVKDPALPLLNEINQDIQSHVEGYLNQANFFLSGNTTYVVSGGAFSVARLIIGQESNLITAPQIKNLTKELHSMTLAQRLQIPHLPEQRADVMPTALSIIEAITNFYNIKVFTHSYHNLRFGLVQALFPQKL